MRYRDDWMLKATPDGDRGREHPAPSWSDPVPLPAGWCPHRPHQSAHSARLQMRLLSSERPSHGPPWRCQPSS